MGRGRWGFFKGEFLPMLDEAIGHWDVHRQAREGHRLNATLRGDGDAASAAVSTPLRPTALRRSYQSDHQILRQNGRHRFLRTRERHELRPPLPLQEAGW